MQIQLVAARSIATEHRSPNPHLRSRQPAAYLQWDHNSTHLLYTEASQPSTIRSEHPDPASAPVSADRCPERIRLLASAGLSASPSGTCGWSDPAHPAG